MFQELVPTARQCSMSALTPDLRMETVKLSGKAQVETQVQALLLTPSCLQEVCQGCQRYEDWKVACG